MSDTPADPVAAYLDDAAKRYRAFGETDAFPRLLAAVKVALGHHQPVEYTGLRCATCYGADGGRAPWPCNEYEALSRALLGEGK